ncbi:hypothetical protein MD484_g8074, partial [Candolleomyces efflorescens]
MRSQIQEARLVIGDNILQFEQPPSRDSHVKTSSLDAAETAKLCLLSTTVPSNSAVIAYQNKLAQVQAFARGYINHRHTSVQLEARLTLKLVEEQQASLLDLLLHEWRRQRKALQEHSFLDTSEYFLKPLQSLPISVIAIYLMVATLHLLSGLSADACSFVLRTSQLILRLLLGESTSIYANSIPKAVHIDPRTVIKVLDVYPRFTALLTCPECSWVHYLEADTPQSDYPESCQHTISGSVCGASLMKTRKTGKGEEFTIPIRRYIHQPMKDYLARLFSRADLADYLDRVPVGAAGKDLDATRDIWDAPGLRKLKGPDGTSFVDGNRGESRLVFSLNMDGFNPGGNREAGKKVSVGGIYMVCLNLPPSIRYNPENVFLVGIVPGPHGPSNDEINYFLKPLVDDLLDLWEHGVFLSRTAKHPHGRRVRCALGPLICDLPAARQMSGFAHYRSRHFCSECDCTMDQINDSVKQTWKPKTRKGHLYAATLWKDAKTAEERDLITNKYGVRWSELLRLPYWDPTMFTLIDSMHAFYLRLFQHHCRSVWGMDVEFDDGPGVTYDLRSNQPTDDEMKNAEHILRHGTSEQLSGLSRPVLRELCRQTSTIPFERKKAVLIEQLLKYRIDQKWFTPAGAHLREPEDSRSSPPSPQRSFDSDVFPDAQALESFWLSASKTRMRKLVRSDLLILFRRKVKSCSEATMVRLKNPELLMQLEKTRFKDGIVGDDGRLIAQTPTKKTRVLGRQTLAEIRDDMGRLGLPTWVARAPSHPGEKKWGKFTADQWKAFCMHHLPVTLTRLWGGAPEGSVERLRLDNFMHLISAVKLATMYSMSESRIQKYEHHMRQYITTLLNLYPGTSLTPYQHLALHFGRQLRMFGPVHAWRCFAFERFNYVLQNFPTNGRFGELEKTMFTKFCCLQNLKALYTKTELPEVLHELITIYEETYASDLRGTRLSEIFSDDGLFGRVAADRTWEPKNFSSLSDEYLALLKQWFAKYRSNERSYPHHVIQRASIYRFGHRFTSLDNSVEDSRVVFRLDEGAEWQVGSILSIFSEATTRGPTEQTWVVIKPFKELADDDTVRDFWSSYPVVGARLFQNECIGPAVLVDVKHIRCHIASCVLNLEGDQREYLLALPLNKVMTRPIRTSKFQY